MDVDCTVSSSVVQCWQPCTDNMDCWVGADTILASLPHTLLPSPYALHHPPPVLGHNCRFLQGPATSKRKVAEIRDAIREDRACNVCLLNYRRDGSTFWNQFYLAPIRDEQGVAMYVGIQCDVSAAVKTACATADDPEALLESFHCGDQPTTDAVERALSTCRVEHLLANVAGQGVGEHGSTGACSCHHGRAADKGAGGAAASLVRPDRHRSTTSISSTGSAGMVVVRSTEYDLVHIVDILHGVFMHYTCITHGALPMRHKLPTPPPGTHQHPPCISPSP